MVLKLTRKLVILFNSLTKYLVRGMSKCLEWGSGVWSVRYCLQQVVGNHINWQNLVAPKNGKSVFCHFIGAYNAKMTTYYNLAAW